MTTEASCSTEHYLVFDNFVTWEQLRLLCIRLQPVIAGEHKAANATWAAVSCRRGGNWFFWLKHSIRTLKISGLCMPLSSLVFLGPWSCCLGANLQRHLGIQLSCGWDIADLVSFVFLRLVSTRSWCFLHILCIAIATFGQKALPFSVCHFINCQSRARDQICGAWARITLYCTGGSVCAGIHVHTLSPVTFSVPF